MNRMDKKTGSSKAGLLIVTLLCLLIMFPVSAAAKPRLNKTTKTIWVGETYRLKVKGGKATKWKSSSKKTASVNQNGLVKGKREGNCKIYAYVGRKKLTCKVTVQKVSLNKTSIELGTGETTTLSLNRNVNASFYSDDPYKVRIVGSRVGRSARIMGRSAGTTQVFAAIGEKICCCTVKILGPAEKRNALAASQSNGLYYRMNSGSVNEYSALDTTDGFITTISHGAYKEYYFAYNGKAYLPYELPRSVEIALLRTVPIFEDFFDKYLAKYEQLETNQFKAKLQAITCFMRDLHTSYDESGGDPIFSLIYNRKGICVHYSNTFQYLCYLAGIECAVVELGRTSELKEHSVNAIRFNGKWWYIEPEWFINDTIDDHWSKDIYEFRTTVKFTKYSYVFPLKKNYNNTQQNKFFTVLPDI